jgi:hypothetical protein
MKAASSTFRPERMSFEIDTNALPGITAAVIAQSWMNRVFNTIANRSAVKVAIARTCKIEFAGLACEVGKQTKPKSGIPEILSKQGGRTRLTQPQPRRCC